IAGHDERLLDVVLGLGTDGESGEARRQGSPQHQGADSPACCEPVHHGASRACLQAPSVEPGYLLLGLHGQGQISPNRRMLGAAEYRKRPAPVKTKGSDSAALFWGVGATRGVEKAEGRSDVYFRISSSRSLAAR